MRVLITGAAGLLGLNACLMQASCHDVYGTTHQTALKDVPFKPMHADLTVVGTLESVIDQSRPDVFLNCAAMAQVDRCEDVPEKAARVNAWMPGAAAALCERHSIPFIHISTDAVFDGKTGGYTEADDPHPLSVYAQTKLDGEKNVLDANANALIARVNFFGHSLSGKRSLAEFFLRNLLAGNPIKGFVDVVFSPLYVKHLVEILFAMFEKGLQGVYHVAGTDRVSKYDFGQRIAERLHLEERLISPISVTEAGLKAQRSPNLFLDTSKLQAAGIQIPSLERGIESFITDYQKKWHTHIRTFQS